MCGRFTLRARLNDLLAEFALQTALAEWEPRYNIAPTQTIPVVELVDAKRELVGKRWGLVPSWAADLKIGNSLLNARSETVARKPSFRSAFKRHRCLIIADGFYEWQKLDAKTKQPYFFEMKDGKPFAFAGLSEHWEKGEKPVDSCTIITTDANQLMAPVHDRMPVILSPDDFDLWLDPEFQTIDHLQGLLKPFAASAMRAVPVSTYVSNVRNQGPECVAPVK